jgi:hypothetical protein
MFLLHHSSEIDISKLMGFKLKFASSFFSMTTIWNQFKEHEERRALQEHFQSSFRHRLARPTLPIQDSIHIYLFSGHGWMIKYSGTSAWNSVALGARSAADSPIGELYQDLQLQLLFSLRNCLFKRNLDFCIVSKLVSTLRRACRSNVNIFCDGRECQ